MSSLFGRYDSAIVEYSWFRSCSHRRLSMVRGSPQHWDRARSLHMLSLNGYRRNMSLVCGSLFFGRRTLVDPTVTAIVADARDRGVVDHRRVVDIVDLSDVYVVH